MKHNILIIDDDVIQARLTERFVFRMGHNPVIVDSGKKVLEFFKNKTQLNGLNTYDIDAVLLDLSMPNIDGFKILEEIKSFIYNLPIIVLTAYKDTNLAIKAINLGAFDYIVKGDRDIFARLVTSVTNALEQKILRSNISMLEKKNSVNIIFSDIVTSNDQMKNIITSLQKVVDSNVPIMLVGESGTGKEFLAKAVHGSGPRQDKPFVVLNCSILRNENMDEICCGYLNIDNTSPKNTIGKFREAEGGTIFLKDINELNLEAQIKLFKILQDGYVEPVNSRVPVKIDVRIISSSSKDLEDEVLRGNLKADLFYRLNVFSLFIPPLRERKDEIGTLMRHFYRLISISENKKINGISDQALNMLTEYMWPGNVRELRNVVFKAIILCEKNILDIIDFPQITRANLENKKKLQQDLMKSLEVDQIVSIIDANGNVKKIKNLETEIIEKTIKLCGGNISDASKKLDLGRSTMYRKLRLDGDLDFEEDEEEKVEDNK